MRGVLIDSNVILDVFLDDPNWASWSEKILDFYSQKTILYINPIIYTEISIGFKCIEELEQAVAKSEFVMLDIPKEALFLAGKAFYQYKRKKGIKRTTLPDFFIGAQAVILGLNLITRDVSRYRTYYPKIKIITPFHS